MHRKDRTPEFLASAKKMIENSSMNEDNVISSENVFQPAIKVNRDFLADAMRLGHKEGSTVLGGENIIKLDELAASGKSCIIFSEHVSNLDVPSMYIRFRDHENKKLETIFEKFIFIAGLKLNQNPMVKLYAEMFSRIVIYPIRSILNLADDDNAKAQAELAKKINFSATKQIMDLKKKGHIFILYPAGTRYREWEPDSGKGMKETMAYLSIFDYFCCCSISGNNMLPAEHEDMTKEKFEEDVIVFNVGEIIETKGYMKHVAEKNPAITDKDEMRQAQVDEIMERIKMLHDEGDKYREKYI